MSCSCREFSRSEVLRRSASAALPGAGLPAIEPGMPVPAGTGVSRRSFMLRGAGVALSVYGAGRLMAPQAFEEGIAQAAAAPSQPVLVSVFLPGGIDSLSVLAPVGDSRYATLRPGLKLAAGSGTTFAEDSRLMWAPYAQGLATLHGEGKVTVLPAIGYDHPDQSHFTSRHFWEVGQTDASARLGWMGRYLDRAGTGTNPLQGLSLDSSLSPALAAASVPVAAVDSPDSYDFNSRNVWDLEDPMLGAFGQLGRLSTADPVLGQARAAQASAATLRSQLAPFTSFTPPVPYPANSDFGHKLSGLAAMLGAGLPLRCVTLNAPGSYDTHADQAAHLPRDLQETVDSVLAFQRDLEQRGLAGRVLTLLWSEFGRRGQENGSGGTDHGAGGAAFLVGARATGQMVGEFPGLTTLDAQCNLRSTSDFRGVYCSLVEQWFASDAAAVIPGATGFARPALVS